MFGYCTFFIFASVRISTCQQKWNSNVNSLIESLIWEVKKGGNCITFLAYFTFNFVYCLLNSTRLFYVLLEIPSWNCQKNNNLHVRYTVDERIRQKSTVFFLLAKVIRVKECLRRNGEEENICHCLHILCILSREIRVMWIYILSCDCIADLLTCWLCNFHPFMFHITIHISI